MSTIPFSILRFCLEHSDDPVAMVNADPASFDRDPADYQWLIAALGDMETDSERMLKLLAKMREPDMTDEKLADILECVQYYVEDYDNLQVFMRKGKDCFPFFQELLSHENSRVRLWSAWIFASLAQNNPHLATIAHVPLSNVLELILDLLAKEPDQGTHNKQLYALSSLLSNTTLVPAFVEKNGIQLLVPWITNLYPGTANKVLWILNKVMSSSTAAQTIAREQTPFLQSVHQVLDNPATPTDVKNTGVKALESFKCGTERGNEMHAAKTTEAKPLLFLGQ